MKPVFLSLVSPPPDGFAFRIPTKRDLLGNIVAIFAGSAEEVASLCSDFTSQGCGIIITTGKKAFHTAIGPEVYHMVVPPAMTSCLHETATLILELMSRGQGGLDENQVLTIELDRCRKTQKQIRDNYNNNVEQLGKLVESLQKEIEARKHVETVLRESKEQYSQLIENANDTIFILQDDRIRFFNRRALDLFGYSSKELESRYFLNFIHPRDKQMVAERYRRRIRGEAGLPNTYSFSIVTGEGAERIVELSTVKIEWQGRPATLNFIRDITEQRKLEASLQQAQKMEALGTLAGGIAHDFNNILTLIIGYTEIAKEELPPGTDCSDDSLDKVLVASKRAQDLIRQILTFSRQTEVRQTPLKLQSIIRETIRMLRPSIPTTIDIRDDIDPECGVVLADATQVHQILMNLCTNAYHAMEKTGGILTIQLHKCFIDRQQKPPAHHIKPGEYAKLIVSDTGSGIPQDIIDKIFDPYFTTKEINKGTGMGLSIIHGIISDYGGTILVESEVGEGSAFHVFFPVIGQEKKTTLEEDADSPAGTGNILFVDDEEMLGEMFEAILGRLGYNVYVHTSSLDALESFRKDPGYFDAVITDQTMPEMTGAELARRVLEIRPDIPVILCTGYSSMADEKAAKALGIKEFVIKPITKKKIAHLLSKLAL